MQVSTKSQLISIIIPAYMQEKTISKDLLQIKSILDATKYAYEILVVVDGFIDNTYQIAKKMESKKIKVYGYKHNQGKGHAIRFGMKMAKGNIVGFIDAGMDLNPNGLSILLERLEWNNADIVIGSKRHPESRVKYPIKRRAISFLSQIFIRILFGLNVRDTQVGMKLFKKKVIKDVLPRLLVNEFAFDIEVLVVAYHLGYHKIVEAPIELTFNFEKSIVSQSLISAILKTFWDSLGIFYRLKIRHNYDKIRK
jgi:glycosyltransferase involved in cell wall biosynthesis